MGRGKGACHEVTMVNFRFHESPNKIKSTGLFKSINIFRLSLLSVGLTQVLNSLRSRKNLITMQRNSATNSTLDVHDSFPYLFTIHSRGLLHFTPHEIHLNHDSRNSFFVFLFFLSIHDSQSTKKKRNTASRKYPCTPSKEKTSRLGPLESNMKTGGTRHRYH